MAKGYTTVDDYIASQPDAARPVLEAVRQAIRSSLPAAEEVISYQIPAYRIQGRIGLFFAGWKKHYSIYPASQALRAAFAGELDPYVVEKATIRFPLSAQVPAALIGRIALFRASEVSAEAVARPRRNRGG